MRRVVSPYQISFPCFCCEGNVCIVSLWLTAHGIYCVCVCVCVCVGAGQPPETGVSGCVRESSGGASL